MAWLRTPRFAYTGTVPICRGSFRALLLYDIAEELRMPVLIVAGAGDKIGSLDEASEMCRAFPAAQLRVMQSSGHLPMLEEPAALTAELAAFVS